MKQRIMHGSTIDAVTPEELAEALAKSDPNVIFGLGGGTIEEVNLDSPMKGTLRQITSFDRGSGSDNFIVPAAAFTDLVDFDPSRIAGTIQNIGAGACYVYMNYAARCKRFGFGEVSGVPVGYLVGNGGTWDFKLSNDVWCGPVCVYSTPGTTLVWGVH